MCNFCARKLTLISFIYIHLNLIKHYLFLLSYSYVCTQLRYSLEYYEKDPLLIFYILWQGIETRVDILNVTDNL